MREIKFRAWCEERKEMWVWEELCGTGKNATNANAEARNVSKVTTCVR